MQEGLKTFGEYGLKVAAVTALGRTPASVYGKAGAAMTTWAAANPKKVQAAAEFLDLAVGYNVPGPPPVSKAGYTGFGIHAAKDIYEKIR
ncbi:hypothetical protein, partial [Paucidesulfovibrio longus]|uniref:hypothetical protein n=1 Tax=Paucidesulfovibrio longus TaxID=889 RepID=UPI00058C8066